MQLYGVKALFASKCSFCLTCCQPSKALASTSLLYALPQVNNHPKGYLLNPIPQNCEKATVSAVKCKFVSFSTHTLEACGAAWAGKFLSIAVLSLQV